MSKDPTYESRWNVADMQGNLFPDEVVEGVTVNPSYSELRQALQDIRQMTVSTGNNPDNFWPCIVEIYNRATEALARKSYDYSGE